MGNGVTECRWRHAPEARGGFGEFWRKLLELSSASGEDSRLSLPHGGLGQVSHELGGGRWKSQNRKNVYVSPYVEEPLNSKVIKSFVPELRSRKCFSCFEIPMFYVYIYTNIMNVLRTGMNISISHICIWLCFSKTSPHRKEYPGDDPKQPDGEIPIMLELWWMRSTLSLPLLTGSLWHRVVVTDRVLSMGQIELNCVLRLNWITRNRTVWRLNCVLMLNRIVLNRTVFVCWTVWNRIDFWHWNCVLMLNGIVWNKTVLTFNCV